MRIHPRFRALTIVLCAALLGGCATYSHKFQPIENALVAHQPERALAELEKRYSPTGPDAALYYLNKATLLRLTGKYADSNAAFEKAQRIIDKVEAISITESAGSVIVNDSMRSYEGEDFEKVLLHLYKALNYLDLAQPYEARVEALQVDVKLRELNKGFADAVFTEEAFARYLTGIIYESLGEWSDALIADRQAYEAYKLYRKKYNVDIPESLKYALLRLTERQGLEDELRDYRAEFGINEWVSLANRAQNGEVVVTVNSGLVAIKGEVASHALDPQSGRLIRIALPVYRPRAVIATQARLRIGDKTVPLELTEDVNALAIKSLESHMVAITARAVARAVVKYKAAQQADKRDPGLGLLVNIAGAVTEQADTRSWSTLPARIYLARVSLEPGTYNAQLELLDASGRLVSTHDFGSVTVTQGKSVYLAYHWTS